MIHDQTIRDLQALIEEIDREMDKLRATLREGERLRETLVKQAMALAWEEGNADLVRIVRNDP